MVVNVYDITKLRAAVLGEPWTSTLADTVTWDSQLWTLVVSTTRDCVLMRCRMSKSESKLTIPRDVFNMFRFSFHSSLAPFSTSFVELLRCRPLKFAYYLCSMCCVHETTGYSTKNGMRETEYRQLGRVSQVEPQ